MSALSCRLRDAREQGGVPAMVACAGALLLDAGFLHAQLSAPEARVDEARRAMAALEAEARDAWRRYPAVGGGGFHSGPPDARPALLNWAVGHIREAGFYSADELERLRAEAGASPAWVGAEALRLSAFLAVLRALTDDFLARTLTPAAYVTAVKELAQQFSHMEVRRL